MGPRLPRSQAPGPILLPLECRCATGSFVVPPLRVPGRGARSPGAARGSVFSMGPQSVLFMASFIASVNSGPRRPFLSWVPNPFFPSRHTVTTAPSRPPGHWFTAVPTSPLLEASLRFPPRGTLGPTSPSARPDLPVPPLAHSLLISDHVARLACSAPRLVVTFRGHSVGGQAPCVQPHFCLRLAQSRAGRRNRCPCWGACPLRNAHERLGSRQGVRGREGSLPLPHSPLPRPRRSVAPSTSHRHRRLAWHTRRPGRRAPGRRMCHGGYRSDFACIAMK